MAALLYFAPPMGASTFAARTRDVVRATFDRNVQARPVFACRWLLGADGRLSCRWDAEPPAKVLPL